MRLALDEHLSPTIAASLAEREIDVLAVVEVEELAGSSDMIYLAPTRFDLRRGRQAQLVDALTHFVTIHPDGIHGLAYWLEPRP